MMNIVQVIARFNEVYRRTNNAATARRTLIGEGVDKDLVHELEMLALVGEVIGVERDRRWRSVEEANVGMSQ